MNPEQANDLMQRYAASKPGLGRSQLAERIVDEVMPELVEALREGLRTLEGAVACGLDGFTDKEVDQIVQDHTTCKLMRNALALARKP